MSKRNMTVAQVIEALKAYPMDSRVLVWDEDGKDTVPVRGVLNENGEPLLDPVGP